LYTSIPTLARLSFLEIVTLDMSLTNASPEDAARAAKISSRTLAILSADSRNAALQEIHDALFAAKDDILAANARDLEIATKSAADGELSQSILKRLDLSRKGKFEDMLKGILDVKELEDPGKPSLIHQQGGFVEAQHTAFQRKCGALGAKAHSIIPP
jgi:gamma-glutamyl phosphate reductase